MAGEVLDFGAAADALMLKRAPDKAPAVDFGAAADKLAADQAAISLKAVEGTNPDQAARALRLSRETGLPLPAVEGAEDDVERSVRAQAAARALEGAPAARAFLSDPGNAKLAHDDAEALAAVEGAWRYGANALKRGALRIEQGVRQYFAEQAAERAADAGRSFADIVAEERRFGIIPGPDELFTSGLRYFTSRIDSDAAGKSKAQLQEVGRLSDRIAGIEFSPGATRAKNAIMAAGKDGLLAAIEAAVSDPAGTMAMAAEVGVESVPQIAAGIAATVATRNPMAGAAVMGVSSGLTERFTSPAEFLQKRGVDLSDATQVARVFANPELMREAQKFGFTRGMIIGSFDAVSGGLASEAFGGPLRNMLTQLALQSVLGGGGEAAAQYATTGEFDWGEVVIEALGEFAMAPVEVAGVGGAYLQDRQSAGRAKSAKERADAVNDAWAAAKLSERSPEKRGELGGAILRDQGIDKVAIPAARLQEFMQAQDADPNEIMRALGVESQMDEALLAGGDVEITPEAFSQHVHGTEMYQGLADHIRWAEDTFTAAEAAEFEKSDLRDEMKRLEGNIAAMDDPTRADAAQIQAEVEAMLVKAGEAPANASYAAVLMASRYATRGVRAGVRPLELWQADNLKVERDGGVARRPGVDDVDLILDKARMADPDKFLGLSKTPVLDALQGEMGGVDPDGPLGAELKNMGLTARGRPGLFKKGGRGAVDNVPLRDWPLFGSAEPGDTSYVPEADILAAIRDEIAGQPRRSPEQSDNLARFTADVEWLNQIIDAYNERHGTALSVDTSPPQEIKAAVRSMEMEQPGQGGNRGSIQFGGAETLIRLGPNADRSTFLHEAGHLFLEQLRADAREFGARAPELVDDLNTVQDWWASNAASIKAEALDYAKRANDTDGIAALEAMSDKAVAKAIRAGSVHPWIDRAMHEQWARGTEDYFRTGQAPSVGLQEAFNRFRAWLVSIYSALKRRMGKEALEVQFSADVRAVMDRLLATDAEIALVEEQYNLKAMFDSAEGIGMTPKQFEAYQRLVARASEDARTRQLKKHLNEVERTKLDWWREERERMESTVRLDVGAQPVYRAMYALATGKQPSGDDLPGGLRPSRMSRAAVAAVLESPDSVKRLPRIDGKALYATRKDEASAHPDVVARLFGYADGRSMLLDMMNAVPFADAVATETDARMKAEFGDLLTDGKAEAEALESAHADKRGDVLAMELNALRESKEKMKPAFVRQWAKERLATRKVDDIRPETFLAAEKRLGREAGKLLRAGDRLGAQRAKFQQLLNFYMAKEAYKVRTETAKMREYLAKFGSTKAKFPAIDADYIDQIRGILEAYNFLPRLSDAKRTSLMEWAAKKAEEDGAQLEIPPEIAAADGRTHFRDLTLDQFRTLHDTIKNIEAQGRNAKTALIDGQERDISDMAREIASQLDGRPQIPRVARRAFEQNPEWGDRVRGRLASADAALRKMEFLLEHIDGERNGVAHRYIFQPFADAEVARNDLTKNITAKIMAAIEGLPPSVRGNLSQRINVPLLNRTFHRSDLLMMALNTGNESNLAKMIDGSAKDITEGATPWTIEGVDEALSQLSAPEWDFVQTVWDAFESMYPQVEAVYRRENGVAPERVEAREIETRWGQTLRGGYFPMMYDPARSEQARDIEAKSGIEAMQSVAVKASVNSSMTKARTGFSAPVLLDIERLPQHIERTAHFVTHYEPVRAVRKLLARRDLARALTNRVGPEYYRSLKDWANELAANGQPVGPASVAGTLVEAMRTNATVAIMGFSYTTMSAQVLGYANSLDALARQPDGSYSTRKGALWLGRGLVEYLRNPADAKRKVFAVSGEMRHRLQNTDREVRHALRQLSGKKGAWQTMQRASLMGIAGIQLYMVDFPVWLGAYNRALAEGMGEPEAARAADSILRTSQTAGGLKDLAAIQRERGVTTAFTMFYSYFSLLYNLQAQAIGSVKRGRDVPTLAARAFILLALPTAAEAILKQEFPDDDEDYPAWIALKTALYGFSALPFLRDLVGMTEGFGYSLSPLDSLGESLGKSVRGLAQALEDGELDAKTMKALVGVFGFATGAPVTQVNRVIGAADAMFEGEDVGPYDFLKGYKPPK